MSCFGFEGLGFRFRVMVYMFCFGFEGLGIGVDG